MADITLEKVDEIIERTGVSYSEAKKALEESNGDVLEALIYIEDLKKNASADDEEERKENLSTAEFKEWIGKIIKKGNVTRVKIKKDDKVIADIPANAGVAATVLAVVLPQVLAVALITAVVVKLTIEIEKEDGTVEVINKYVEEGCKEVKTKATEIVGNIKDKVNEVKSEAYTHSETRKKHGKNINNDQVVYTYKVNFDDTDQQ